MKVEFLSKDEAGSYFMFVVFHGPTAGGWVPLNGDRMYWGGVEWLVMDRYWVIEEGELAVLQVYLRKEE